mmetsp:Transcript_54456/g.127154  ORF Transcript_54456/g.127154 Transcript_54456/m.127154 type:complete len:528 (-) Transcript_54456:11-1594(-)
MGLKAQWAPLNDLLGFSKLQELLLTLLDTLDKQDERHLHILHELGDLRACQKDSDKSIAELSARLHFQEETISETQKTVATLVEKVDKSHAQVIEEVTREAKQGAAEGTKELSTKLDELKEYRNRLRDLEVQIPVAKQAKSALDAFAKEMRQEIAAMTKRFGEKPAEREKEVGVMKLELIEVADGMKAVGKRLVSLEERVNVVESQPRINLMQASPSVAGDESADGSPPASPGRPRLQAQAAVGSYDETMDLLGRFKGLSRKAQLLEEAQNKQEIAHATLVDQTKLHALTLDGLRSDMQGRMERFGTALKKQEADLVALEAKIDGEIKDSISTCVKKQEIDLTSTTETFDGIKHEIINLYALLEKDSSATARCLTCYDARKQAVIPSQVGTDGKQYRKRPSTAGGPEAYARKAERSPERSDLQSSPLDMWFNSPGKTALRQQQPNIQLPKQMKGAHRSLLCPRLKPSSTTPALGLTDCGSPMKATLLAADVGQNHVDPLVELAGPDLRLARGVRTLLSPSHVQQPDQ